MKKTAMFGLLAMVLAFGFIGMGCPTNDDGGDSWGNPDPNLVGTWYTDQEFTEQAIGITMGGDFEHPGLSGATATIQTNGSKYRITITMSGQSVTATGNWKAEGDTLTLSNGDAELGNGFDGTYYRES